MKDKRMSAKEVRELRAILESAFPEPLSKFVQDVVSKDSIYGVARFLKKVSVEREEEIKLQNNYNDHLKNALESRKKHIENLLTLLPQYEDLIKNHEPTKELAEQKRADLQAEENRKALKELENNENGL